MIKSTDFEFSLLLKCVEGWMPPKVLYHAYVVYVTIYCKVTFCFCLLSVYNEYDSYRVFIRLKAT